MKNAENIKLLIDLGINVEECKIELNCDIDNISIQLVHRALQLFDKKELVTVYLTTYGGDPYAAFAIYDLLRQFDGFVTVVCVGGVFSAGTIIMQAGDARYMLENSTLLIHFGAASAEDKATKIQHDKLDKKICDLLTNAVVGKRTRKTVNKWFERESYFTAHEALDAGLIDGILHNE